MMPMLFVLLLVLAGYNYFAGGFSEALDWLFTPDFSKIGPTTVLAAIGQAFFSIGVAMGGMMTYGSYLRDDDDIITASIAITVLDTHDGIGVIEQIDPLIPVSVDPEPQGIAGHKLAVAHRSGV